MKKTYGGAGVPLVQAARRAAEKGNFPHEGVQP